MIGWLLAGFVVVVLIIGFSYRPLKRIYREITAERAHELFQLQREMLEAKFFELARSAGNPRGAVWSDCEFESESSFARHQRSGEIVSFVEITVHFAPAPAKDSEFVGSNRQATAVFHYHHGQWGTGGRTLFDMSPTEALEHFGEEYENISFIHHP